MIAYDRKLMFLTTILIIAAVSFEVVPFVLLKWHEYAFERECEKTCRISGQAARILPLNPNTIVQPGQAIAAWRCLCV